SGSDDAITPPPVVPSVTESMEVSALVYRMDNRKLLPINSGRTQEFTIHACHQSQVTNEEMLVSKSWKCTSPSAVVSYVLSNCAGVQNMKVDPSQPPKDYIAENIHPFQVVAQQAQYALNNGIPDFLHYMTLENDG